MMKSKMKKIMTVMLTAAIGITALAGCGSKAANSEESVEKILKGKTQVLAATNMNLSMELIMSMEEEEQQSVTDVIVNNETKEWYAAFSNIIDEEKSIFNEMLIINGEAYYKYEDTDKWEAAPSQDVDVIYGVESISMIELKAEDYKGVKESKEDGKIIISIKPTEGYIDRFKEKNVKDMEQVMEEYKNSPNVIPQALESNMMSLEALRKTNYKDVEYTFAIDKEGALVGYKSKFVIEEPEVVQDSNGKFVLSEDLKEISMTSNIIINSYNDSNNEEQINKIKAEL